MFQIDGTIIVIFASFLVFIVLMKAIYFGPMLHLKNERDAAIDGSRQTAEKAEEKRLQSELEIHARLGEAHRQAQQVIAQQRDAAKAQATQTLAQARQDAEQTLKTAFDQIHAQQNGLYAELASDREALAQGIIGKLAPRHPSATH